MLREENLVELFTMSDDDDSYVGYIRYEDENSVTLEIIDELGRYSSMLWIREDNIGAMDAETDELKKMEAFVEYGKKKSIYEPFDLSKADITSFNPDIKDILGGIMMDDQIIIIESKEEEDFDIGYVDSIEDDSFTFISIDLETCEEIGYRRYLLSEIVFVEYDSSANLRYRYVNQLASINAMKI